MTTRPELCLVIPAKNEAANLPTLLHSLTQQDYPHRAHTTVFVADAESTDATVPLALGFSGRLDIRILPGGMPSVGRNRGARASGSASPGIGTPASRTPDAPASDAPASASRYILFLDADVELRDPTLIRRAVESMRRHRLHCLTVDIVCKDGTWADRMLYRGNSLMQRLSRWLLPFGTGMFLLFDRERFNQLGGFREDAVFAEDFLLTKQVSRRRFRVLRGAIYTSNRRFRRTGHTRMVLLFFWTLLNSRSSTHFQHDHGYWDEAPLPLK